MLKFHPARVEQTLGGIRIEATEESYFGNRDKLALG